LSLLATTIDPLPDDEFLIALARKHRLTAYDASYLELAMRRRLPLATLDAALIAAAGAEGVPLVGESG
jgi:predicted nucleic acid-binding protein